MKKISKACFSPRRKIKIGLPKGLLWYKYHRFWEVFFKELGAEVVKSSDTNKKIVEEGTKKSVDELCIPVKIFFGSCLDLIDKCDWIFIPRYWIIDRKSITCPKLITLPDTAIMIIRKKILTTTINIKRKPIFLSFFFLGLKLKKNPLKVIQAYRAAIRAQEMNETYLEKEFQKKLASPLLTVAVVGHEYNIYDNYINQELISEIEKQNVNIITSDLVPQSLSDTYLKEKPFIYWSYEREIIGTAYWALSAKKISGLILISSFNCGPDSLLHEQLLLEDSKKPILSILVDENISKETVKTRIEAFLEMLKRKGQIINT